MFHYLPLCLLFPSLSLITVFILKSILYDMNKTIPAFSLFPFAWKIFLHLFIFRLCLFTSEMSLLQAGGGLSRALTQHSQDKGFWYRLGLDPYESMPFGANSLERVPKWHPPVLAFVSKNKIAEMAHATVSIPEELLPLCQML